MTVRFLCSVRFVAFALLLIVTLAPCAHAQINVHVSTESLQAFDDYVKSAETSMDWRPRFQPKKGEINIVAGTPSHPEPTTDIKDALIHDWSAATFIPGATLEKTLAVLQSYDDYKKMYAPHVTDSKTLEHHPGKDVDRWKVYLKLNKSKGLIVAVLDSEYDVEYKQMARDEGNPRWIMLSRSSKINEIQFGKVQPVGIGLGFLWRLNAYWVLERRGGGVYLECRTISMSRDIPTGTAWMIKPVVTSLPKESLRDSLTETVKAIQK